MTYDVLGEEESSSFSSNKLKNFTESCYLDSGFFYGSAAYHKANEKIYIVKYPMDIWYDYSDSSDNGIDSLNPKTCEYAVEGESQSGYTDNLMNSAVSGGDYIYYGHSSYLCYFAATGPDTGDSLCPWLQISRWWYFSIGIDDAETALITVGYGAPSYKIILGTEELISGVDTEVIQREFPCIQIIDDYVYVLGGDPYVLRKSFSNFETDYWQVVGDLTLSGSGFTTVGYGSSCVKWDTYIYLIGGYIGSQGPSANVLLYDTTTGDSIIFYEILAYPTVYSASVFVPTINRIYNMGGSPYCCVGSDITQRSNIIALPTISPTRAPTTLSPTPKKTTLAPTHKPTSSPIATPTAMPTRPTKKPTVRTTKAPTLNPTPFILGDYVIYFRVTISSNMVSNDYIYQQLWKDVEDSIYNAFVTETYKDSKTSSLMSDWPYYFKVIVTSLIDYDTWQADQQQTGTNPRDIRRRILGQRKLLQEGEVLFFLKINTDVQDLGKILVYQLTNSLSLLENDIKSTLSQKWPSSTQLNDATVIYSNTGLQNGDALPPSSETTTREAAESSTNTTKKVWFAPMMVLVGLLIIFAGAFILMVNIRRQNVKDLEMTQVMRGATVLAGLQRFNDPYQNPANQEALAHSLFLGGNKATNGSSGKNGEAQEPENEGGQVTGKLNNMLQSKKLAQQYNAISLASAASVNSGMGSGNVPVISPYNMNGSNGNADMKIYDPSSIAGDPKNYMLGASSMNLNAPPEELAKMMQAQNARLLAYMQSQGPNVSPMMLSTDALNSGEDAADNVDLNMPIESVQTPMIEPDLVLADKETIKNNAINTRSRESNVTLDEDDNDDDVLFGNMDTGGYIDPIKNNPKESNQRLMSLSEESDHLELAPVETTGYIEPVKKISQIDRILSMSEEDGIGSGIGMNENVKLEELVLAPQPEVKGANYNTVKSRQSGGQYDSDDDDLLIDPMENTPAEEGAGEENPGEGANQGGEGDTPL